MSPGVLSRGAAAISLGQVLLTDLAHADEVLPQRTLHGLGQHRTPVALLGSRAVAGVEGIAKAIEQFRLAAERRRGAGDDGVEAVPRGPVGKGGRAQLVVRVGSGERSLADPIWPHPSVVPGRCNDREPTLDPT